MTWIGIVENALVKCTDCGLCLSACPTFTISRAEGDSPRGRVHLLDRAVTEDQPDTISAHHLAGCIECGACHVPCPTGVRVADARQAHRSATEWLDPLAFERRVTDLAKVIDRDAGTRLTIDAVRDLLDATSAADMPDQHSGSLLLLFGPMLRRAAPSVVDELRTRFSHANPGLIQDSALIAALERAGGLLRDAGLTVQHDRAIAEVADLVRAHKQAVADEEDGSRLGADHLLKQGLLEADGAVVAEPTGCKPSLAQLGNVWAEITIVGSAAHAGHPERGTDAFRVGLTYLSRVEQLLVQVPKDPQFPQHPRLNVGHFAMPGHPGTIPGQCVFRCDIRVLPGVERDDVFALYQGAADAVVREYDVSILVEHYRGGGCQSHDIDPHHQLAQAFTRAQRATRHTAATMPFTGGTDARYFAMAGTPALVYGPGSLEQAHAPDEYVPIDQLRIAERQLTLAALTFLGGQTA